MNDLISVSELIAALVGDNKQTPQYTTFTRTIEAGGHSHIARQGDFIAVLEAELPFRIGLDDQPMSSFERGISFRAPTLFNKIRLENPHAAPLKVRVGVGKGNLRDARLSLDDDLSTFAAPARSIASSKVLVNSGEQKQIASANLARLEMIVTNLGSNPVFLGDSSVSWGQGLPLAAGHTATLKTQSDVYAYAQASGTQTLAILENEK